MKALVLFCLFFVLVLGRKGFGPTDQEWGYVTVRDKVHMFWWLHFTTAASEPTERPLVIWLQGGPGSSSTGFGNFAEIGPLDADLNPRNTSWTNHVNLLFVDNPVGTGYSYVEDDDLDSFASNNTQIAKDFVELLKGFYDTQPDFKSVPLYILCESYGGKMTAEIALVLSQEIKKGNIESNLKGIGLGDSWISPIDSVLTWAPYLLSIGAVDQNGYEAISEAANETKAALDNGQYYEATQLWSWTEGVIQQYTYGIDFYNVLTKIYAFDFKLKNKRKFVFKPEGKLRNVNDEDAKIAILMNSDVRKALNVSVIHGKQSNAVFSALATDFMKPVTDVVEQLLNDTDVKVFVYNGQLDLIVDTPGTINWVDNLKWSGSKKWHQASRDGVIVDGIYEGYSKTVETLAFYWVNRAGHMVPADNPAAMQSILEDLTDNFSV